MKIDQIINSRAKTRLFHSISVWAVFFVLTIIKGSDRLLHAGIWAEDGKVFLKQAFELGWSSLLTPYDGYFHSLPRLIALAVSWLPLVFIPTAIVLICYAIFAYSISIIISESYRWLFPHKIFAVFCGLLLLLSPGQLVMLGNTANLHWYLLFILAIYGLKDIDKSYTVVELSIALICIASEGAALILTPLYISRIVIKKYRESGDCRGEYLILFFIFLFTLINIFFTQPAERSNLELSSFSAIFLNHLYYFFILHIFTGDSLLSMIPDNKVTLKYFAIFLCLCLFYWFSKKWQDHYLLIIVFSLCSLLLPPMIAAVRPHNISIITDYFHYDTYDWFRFRYSFFIPAVASIFWCFVISRIFRPRWLTSVLIFTILSIQIYGGRYRLAIDRYEEIDDWYLKAPMLEKSFSLGCPSSVLVKISPPGWTADFISPAAAECEE